MDERKPEISPTDATEPRRVGIIERLRRRRLSWGERTFDDNAGLVRRMRDRRAAWGGDGGSGDGGSGDGGGCGGK